PLVDVRLDGVGGGQDVAVCDHALEQAGLRDRREVGGVAALGLDDELLLELSGAVVGHLDAGALGELLEGVLHLVGLDLTDGGEERDALALVGAVLLEGRTVGLRGGVVTATTTTSAPPEVVSAATGGKKQSQGRGPRHDRPGTSLLTSPH